MWKTVLFLVFMYSSNASAHGGGLDSNGGHRPGLSVVQSSSGQPITTSPGSV